MAGQHKIGRHEGVTVRYTTCWCNCGGNHNCVIKALVKDGKVVAVEPDDRYNKNMAREDEHVTTEDLLKVRLQRRPCVMGLAFHKYSQHPDRILYPLKRKPGSKRGEGQYVRITWDEAISTIAARMNEAKEKYGPYSVITPYSPNAMVERIFSFWGAGAEGWGWCSYDAARLMAQVITGYKGWAIDKWSSASAPDMLANSKLVVLWGNDPTVGHQGPAHQWGWYIKLAREKGVPVIIIDPRYSMAAKVLADQWIPIKPGTDTAMFMAMANVLFHENLWDRAFVGKYLEPAGFERWKNYILGFDEDGIEKTPEWAEKRCAVPAESIRALARMAGQLKPAVFLWAHFSLSRKSHGEQTISSFAALQAMLGSWGAPGGGPSLHPGPYRPLPVVPSVAGLGGGGDYKVPKLYRSHQWAQAVLLLDQVKSGKLSKKQYMKNIGWKADPAILEHFNPKVLFWGGGNGPHASNHLVTACNSSDDQVKAMMKMDFIVSMHSMKNPTNQMADIILPAQDPIWEGKGITRTAAYGLFECVNFNPGVVDYPGEVKHWVWVYCQLAEKLGVDPNKFFKYYTTGDNFEHDWERYLKDTYRKLTEFYHARGKQIPKWEQFIKGAFLNCDELADEPFTGWEPQMERGETFGTRSGKIELYSEYIADETNRGKGEHYDFAGVEYDNLPADWGDMTPYPTYMPPKRGMDDPLVKRYPLMLLTSHSRYRVHYLFWEHPWLRNHVYRHRVWINVADAAERNIRDNDLLKVYNDQGVLIMPAYVTSRIMPGIVLIHAGGKYIPGRDGKDYGATPATLLGGDTDSCFAPARATTLVQIVKQGREEDSTK